MMKYSSRILDYLFIIILVASVNFDAGIGLGFNGSCYFFPISSVILTVVKLRTVKNHSDLNFV